MQNDLVYSGGTLTIHDAAASLPTPTLPGDGTALEPLTTGVVNRAGATVRALPETTVWYLTTAGIVTAPILWAFADGDWFPAGPLKSLAGDVIGNDSGRVAMGAGWVRVAVAGAVSAPVTFVLEREERSVR